MINFISSWAEQVIIAVIIATIIEMILPSGNSKKYIKTVIGIYILYTIISPVITGITGSNLKVDYSKYEDYFTSTDEYKSLENEFNNVTANSIENTYKQEIKKQLKSDIENMGFSISNVELDIDLETGKIKAISLSADKEEKSDTNTAETNIQINKVEIGNGTSKNKDNNLSRQEIEKIKNFLQENYGTDFECIKVNSI